MEMEKAKLVCRLYARRDDLKASILTMRSRYENNRFGTTNLTIPTQWLPEIVAIAARELGEIDEEIEKL